MDIKVINILGIRMELFIGYGIYLIKLVFYYKLVDIVRFYVNINGVEYFWNINILGIGFFLIYFNF